jgi:hypothetical protein
MRDSSGLILVMLGASHTTFLMREFNQIKLKVGIDDAGQDQ